MPLPPPANVTRMTLTSTLLVAGSASSTVRAQVAGPRRAAAVVHAGRSAVYLELGGSCVAVLARGAVQVPCGVRTSLPVLPDVRPGDEIVVLDGRITLPGCEVVVDSTVDTMAPRMTAAAATWCATELAALVAPLVEHPRRALPEEALARLAAGDPRSALLLLGLGAGLTPLGDDVLCGWLATAVAVRRPTLDALRDQVALLAPHRTTTLSATLLSCAGRGEGVPEFCSLVQGLAESDWPTVERSAEQLSRVGESSGAGLLLGTQLALEVAR